MVAAIFAELNKAKPKQQFTVGIVDNVTRLSLEYDHTFSTRRTTSFRPCFSAWGATGTVSANRNSVKIVGENTPLVAQGYFVYDSRRRGP